ncbi:MAG: MBG domain-containing protein [Bacteroidota bacterium]
MKQALILVLLFGTTYGNLTAQCNNPVFSVNEDFSIFLSSFDSETLPACWERAFPSGASDQTSRIRLNADNSNNAFMQVQSGNGSGGDNGIVLLPTPSNYRGQLSFKAKFSQFSSAHTLEVVAYLGGRNATSLGTFVLSSGWQTFNIDLSNYNANGNEESIGFRHISANRNANFRFDVDDVVYTSGCPTNPTAIANTRDISVQLDENGDAVISPQDVDNGSQDQCGNGVTLSLDRTSFTCSDVSNPVTVLLTATAVGGQIDTETAVVTIIPYVGSQTFDVFLDAAGSATLTIPDVLGTNTCSGLQYGFGEFLDASINFNCTDVGNVVTQSIEAVQQSGPGTRYGRLISFRVLDNLAPAFVNLPASYTVSLGNASSVVVNFEDDIVFSTEDNCSTSRTVTSSLSKNTFTCNDIGDNVVQAILVDESGNQSTQNIIIRVESGITPQTVSTSSNSSQCIDGSTSFTITLDGSEVGVEYLLIDEADGSTVDGPETGTGNPIDFVTGNLQETTTFEVVAQTPPPTGSSYNFDGAYASAVRTWDFDYDQGFTLEFAFNGNTTPVNFFNTLFSLGDMVDNDLEIYFQEGSSTLVVGKGRGTSSFQFEQYASPTSNTDIHIAVVFEPSASQKLRTYYNGIEQTSTSNNPITTIPRSVNTARWSIGQIEQSQFSTLNAGGSGRFDEVRVWSSVRSESDILANMDGCVEATTPTLQHYFKMDEGSGNMMSDAVGDLDLAINTSGGSGSWANELISCAESACQIPMFNTVTIGDLTPPQVVFAATLDLDLDDAGNAVLNIADAITTASDDCTDQSALTLNTDITQFDCSDIGSNTVNVTVTDEAGNKTAGSIAVNVQDVTGPIISPNNLNFDPDFGLVQLPPLSFALDANNEVVLTLADLRSTVADNCGSVASVSINPTTFTCAEQNGQDITITATDAAGNQSTAIETVVILDQTAPTAVARDISITLDANGAATVDPTSVDDGSFDNCSSNLSFSLAQTAFTCTDLGVKTVEFTVRDEDRGVNASTNVTITVEDLIDPIVVARDITVELEPGNNPVTVDPIDVDNGSSDNCSFTLSLDKTNFTSEDLGSNMVTLTATDASGNSASTTATLTIVEGKQIQTITFSSLPDVIYGATPINLTATASSGLPVSYAVEGPATLNGTQISVIGVGTVEVTASQSGDNDFGAAADVQQSFSVSPARITITPDDKEVFIGTDILPAFTLSYSGFVNGDDTSVFGFQASADAPTANLNVAGDYPIVIVQDAIANNYVFTNEQGTLTVTRPLSAPENSVSIYPNPTEDLIKIAGLEYEKYHLISIDGKVVQSQSGKQAIDLSELKAGKYVLQLIKEEKLIHTQSIIKR